MTARERTGGMQPLRVLTVTNMYPQSNRPQLGTFVAEEVESLRRCGVCIDVHFIDGPASKRHYFTGTGALVRSLAADGPYDLVHAHYVFCGLIALFAMRSLPAQSRLPIVLTQHGIETQVGWTAPVSRFASRRVDFTIATSQRVAAAVGGSANSSEGRLAVIPCGVDTDVFRPIPKAAAREALGLPASPPIVLFVGAPRPEKRLPLIREAYALLRHQLPEVRLLLIHNEPRERVALYMNAADVLVLASIAEGSPMVVREALACNLSVVSTDVGDVGDLLAGLPRCHLSNGRPEDLAALLKRSLLADGAREAALATGRERILPWSLPAVAGRIEQVYRHVLERVIP